MEKRSRGGSICVRSEFKNSSGAFDDPSVSLKVSFWNQLGTVVVDEQAMSNDSTGKDHYLYSIPADAVTGIYDVRVTADDAGIDDSVAWLQFEVI